MASIFPPSRGEIGSHDWRAWAQVFAPHYDTMVAWGLIDGAYPLSYGGTITGYNNADNEVAFREGSTKLAYGADLAGDTIYLVSSSASDTDTYRLQGIDANGDYQTADVVATGTTPAAASGTWDHVQRCINITGGGAANVGTVYTSTKSGAGVPATTGDQIQTVIAPGDNYAINPELMCPNDMVFTINEFDFSQDAAQGTTIRIMANRQGSWILNFKFFCGNDDQFSQTFHTPLRLFAGDRLRVLVEAGGGTSASAAFGMNGVVLDVTNLNSNEAGIGHFFR